MKIVVDFSKSRKKYPTKADYTSVKNLIMKALEKSVILETVFSLKQVHHVYAGRKVVAQALVELTESGFVECVRKGKYKLPGKAVSNYSKRHSGPRFEHVKVPEHVLQRKILRFIEKKGAYDIRKLYEVADVSDRYIKRVLKRLKAEGLVSWDKEKGYFLP